jgi:hypothetical protein
MKLCGGILATAAFLGGIRLMAAGVDRPIVAVFNIEAQGIHLPADVLDRLTNYLGSLVAEKGYQIVPRSELKKRLLDQKAESQKMCYDTTCQIELGKELSAQKSLATQLIKLGGACKITLTFYDLKKSASEAGVTASGECDENGLVKSLETAAKKMADGSATAQTHEAKTESPD